MNTVHVVVPGDVDDPAVPSGGNTYDRRLCRGLADLGFDVRAVALPGAWPRPEAAAREALAESLAALPDDALVIADGLVACGVPEVIGPEAERLRFVVLVHMSLADDTALPPEKARELDERERVTLRAATAVVTTSAWTARRLAARHGLAGDRVHVVTPGTDRAPLSSGTDGASRLLCVASVSSVKGQDLLVRALATLTDLPWTCDLVGSLTRAPAYAADLRRLVDRYGLGDRVRFTGPLSGALLAAVYSVADLVVLASRAETYGMVAAEALARGVPVLAPAVGGLPGTVGRAPGGETAGLLVPPGDASALAHGLRRWLAEPRLREDLRASARERRTELTGWEATAHLMAGVLKEAA